MDRDNFMSADEAKTFGLIDHVVKERPRTLDKDGTPAPTGPTAV